MKILKTLSNRGVDLVSFNNQIAVKRRGTAQQLSRILNFYQHTEFPYRPKILQHKQQGNDAYIIEEFIAGEHSDFVGHKELQSLIDSLLPLYKHHNRQQNLQNFMHQAYLNKLQSLPPFDEQTLALINFFFGFFLKNSDKNQTIQVQQIHGDLKPDNIILQQDQAILIDREWNKISHYVEDLQKFIDKTFHYQPKTVDSFLNLFFKGKTISRKNFLYLESFFFFLNKILDLAKGRINKEDFTKLVEEKINQMDKARLYKVKLHNKAIKIGTHIPLSDIFKDQQEIAPTQSPDLISTINENNNQQQRLLLNTYLMIENKDFIIVHGAACTLQDGKKILITGPSGVGKSHTIKQFQKHQLLQELYEEDLINLNHNGQAFALAEKTFHGYQNGKYLYQEVSNLSFGKIDAIIQILPQGETIKIPQTINKKNLIHESLLNNENIEQHYQKFRFPPDIKILTLQQHYTPTDFTLLLQQLGNHQSS